MSITPRDELSEILLKDEEKPESSERESHLPLHLAADAEPLTGPTELVREPWQS